MKTLHSSLLEPYEHKILHAFSTRHDGVSKPPYYQNNLAFHVNDDLEDVKENHLQFSKYLGYPQERLMHMNQVHGDTIMIIDEQTDLKNIPTCDAMITQLPKVPLMVMVADCIPVLLYDPIHQAIGVVHAGRAGILKQIIPKTIQHMIQEFSSSPDDICVVLGPSIRQCCYKVGQEILDETIALKMNHAIENRQGHYYLDLITLAHDQLAEIGITQEHIDTSPYCTACHNNLLFSYRASQQNCGRFAGVMMLR